MIAAFLRAATALGDDEVAVNAKAALDYLLAHHFVDGDLYRSSLGGRLSAIPGQLEDWAGLGMALIKAHGFFGDKHYFDKAVGIAKEISKRFGDELLFDTEAVHTQTPVRPRTLTDSGYPSSHPIAAELYRNLYLLTGDSQYLARAESIVGELSALMARAPRATSSGLHVLVALVYPVKEFASIGAGSLLHQHLRGLPDDGSALSAGEPNDTPLLREREYVAGEPTVYICEKFSCKLPVTTVAALEAQLDSGSEPT